jgi:hypothetical protein
MNFKGRKMKSKSIMVKIALIAIVSTFITTGTANADSNLTISQQTKVKALFNAFASADPNKIYSAKLKYTVTDSDAFKFSDFVQNYYSTIQYFKGINSFGMPNNKVITLETKGKIKVTSKTASLDSSYSSFDLTASNFTFDKKGKIRSWSIKSNIDGKYKKLNSILYSVETTASSGGLSGENGYVYVQPDAGTTLQIKVKNTATNLKSWSYAGGQYGAPNNKWFAVETKPSGCLFPGQTAYLIAELSETPQIVKGTGAVIEAPVFNGCGDGSNKIGGVIRFLTN